MAQRHVKMLSRDGIIELATRSAAARALATVLILLPEDQDPDAPSLAVACVVYARQGGFMVVAPSSEVLQNAFSGWSDEVGSEPAFYTGVAELETPRGRGLGQDSVLLIDVGWEYARFFAPSSAYSKGSNKVAIQFELDGALARPSKPSVLLLADNWIASNMPEAAAQDYLTGEDVADAELLADVGSEPGIAEHGTHQASTSEVAGLQRRVQELEQALAQKNQRPVSGPGLGSASLAATPKAPPLFGAAASPATMTSTDWARLQRLAGPAPKVGAAEQARAGTGPVTREANNILTMMEKEAEAAETMEADLGALTAGQNLDPWQQMLVSQLQQNQLLLQRLAGPKHSDPVLSILDASGNGSGSSSSGVRGCIARDAYIRSMQDLTKLAEVVQANAAKELGLGPNRIDESLLRKYAERRMPLAESKLMTYLAFMMAEAWAVGHASNNLELLGIVGKVMIFLEQASIDQGRLQLAWLLTGQQDPPFQILQSNKKKSGLTPFSRLAAPAWVAANLQYVKDLDVLESKMLGLGKTGKPAPPDPGDDEDPPRNPRRNPKNKGKKGDQGQDATSSGA